MVLSGGQRGRQAGVNVYHIPSFYGRGANILFVGFASPPAKHLNISGMFACSSPNAEAMFVVVFYLCVVQ